MLYDLEVLKLYDVSTASFSENDEKFKHELIEKSTRVFGVKKLAVFMLDPAGKQMVPYCTWGFNKLESMPDLHVLKRRDASNVFTYSFETGLLYFEFATSLPPKEQRLLKVFVRRLEDMLEKKQYRKYLEFVSVHDVLTGLYNRTFFEAELKRLDHAREYPISIILIDVDGLKLVNDTMGHDMGDALLKSTARLLDGVTRKYDILARVGGDEFAMLLSSTSEKACQRIVDRIHNQMAEYNNQNPSIPVNASLGYATAKKETEPLEEVYKIADNLLYHNKLDKEEQRKSQVVNHLMKLMKERNAMVERHPDWVRKISKKIGEKIDLTDEQLKDLELLIKYCDIGEVTIPTHIFLKKIPLSEGEWHIIQQHAEKGYRIALASPDLSRIADRILKHHEWWNGNGYPIGLGGEDIPIECRIFAVTSAYDAMLCPRPYREAKHPYDALNELKHLAGYQFDPHVVDEFIQLITAGEQSTRDFRAYNEYLHPYAQ